MSTAKRRLQGASPNTVLTGIIGAAVLGAVALGTVACDGYAAPAGPQWVGQCVDTVTGMRVDDYECGMPSLIYSEYYVDTYAHPSYSYAHVGQRVNITNITIKNPPVGSSRSTSLPSSGGSASSVRGSLATAPAPKASSGGSGSGTANSSGANGGSSSVTRGGLGVKSGGSSGSSGSVGSRSGGGVSSGS